MKKEFVSERVIEHADQWSPAPAEYEDCTFRHLDLSGTSLADYSFTDCQFTDCNLSNIAVSNTSFREVRFRNCKMLGILFEDCHTFLLEMSFDNCNLGMASFRALKLPGTVFNACILHEADFSEANMKQAVFRDCDLLDAVFDYTELENADLVSARNYRIHPERNRLKGARFSYPEVEGLLAAFGVVLV
ncbi:MAG: pentapeptide repeat-containing protein [Saprospiraceae bacterium]|jgi:uncharacterized protein YjbI with pentapeptide repeats|nr:pentapeptide repeat-containing protein [Saprospiraceae bacterium]